MGMSTGIEHDPEARDAALTVMLPPDQLETVARRAADLVADGRDDGFMDVDGAAAFLSLSPKAISLPDKPTATRRVVLPPKRDSQAFDARSSERVATGEGLEWPVAAISVSGRTWVGFQARSVELRRGRLMRPLRLARTEARRWRGSR
jgi:hypothetical protein